MSKTRSDKICKIIARMTEGRKKLRTSEEISSSIIRTQDVGCGAKGHRSKDYERRGESEFEAD
ncbi:hypothetical protein [Extibacter muris]|uniref:hypothetical protein n=1 Tax=Extibacter muris TaxID=1796622 RepID=UPI0011AEB80C|nr:hypothetical protein [Extibacter muris]